MNKDLSFRSGLMYKHKDDVTEEEWEKIGAEIKYAHCMLSRALSDLNSALSDGYNYDKSTKDLFKTYHKMFEELEDIVRQLDENYVVRFLGTCFMSDIQASHGKKFADDTFHLLKGER